jgi:hypothetical protein
VCRWSFDYGQAAWPFLAIAALQAVLGLAHSYGGEGPAGLARGTYVNRNHYVGFLEMCLPFAVWQAVAILRRGRNRFPRPGRQGWRAC